MKHWNNNTLKASMLVFAVSMHVSSIQAQPDTDDFAFQARLSESNQALQRVELPMDVLLSLTRDDLGDVQVFDASGKLLPSWVRQKGAQTGSEQVELIFHRFSTLRELHSKTISTRQLQSQNNQTSELQTIETIPMHSARQDYIIELSEKQQALGLKHVQLQWTHEPSDQMLKLRVEVGKDLDDWSTLHASKSLTNRDDIKSQWSRIEAIPSGYKYIRLTSLDPVQSFELLKVSAVYEYTKPNEPIWHTLAAMQADSKHEGLYRFALPEGLRAHQMRLKPVQQQSFIKGDLYASHGDYDKKITIKRNWQQHSFNNSNEIQPSKPVQIKSYQYKNWWFYSSQSLDNPPEIEVAYPAYEILFLNNNHGPFTLAWGNYDAAAPANDLIQILGRNVQDIQAELVNLSDVKTAGGASRLTPEMKNPWLKWLLWFLLFIALLVTAKMALSLYRDMNPG